MSPCFFASCAADSTVPEPTPEPPIRVSGVAMNRPELTMTVGDREFLTAELTPQNADNQLVTWSSSDAAVATVDERGEVNALAAGRTTIAVRTLDGGFQASCLVTIAGKDTPEDPDPSDPENPDQSDPKNPDPGDPENPDPGDPENPDPENPAEPPLSGDVGSLAWSLDAASGTLTISGSGTLPDWPGEADGAGAAPPWSDRREQIVTLVLPAGIAKIGANNFALCANLMTVEIAAATPPELGAGNFDGQYSDTLIVPKASLELYQSTAWWDAFGTIEGRE